MSRYDAGLIPLSAVLYALAFVFPETCFWFVFIFLIPLYWYGSTHLHVSVLSYGMKGFVWGLIFFSVHMYAIVRLCIEQAARVHACIMSVLLLGYCSSVSMCWFLAVSCVSKRTTSKKVSLVAWVVTTCCYIEYIDRFLFRCISLPRGYGFAYPLVPLAHYPQLLRGLGFLSPIILVFCICASSACLVYCCVAKSNYAGFFSLFVLLPYLVCFVPPPEKAHFPYQDVFIHVKPPGGTGTSRATELDLAQEINHHIQKALQQYPEAACLFFPESTYPFALDQAPDMYQLWKDNALSFGQNVNIIMGAHHAGKNKNQLKNAVFCINDCRIIPVYVKQTYVPFAEFIPWPWNRSIFFRNFLLKNKQGFHQESSVFPPLFLLPDLPVSFYICSDLFFNNPRADGKNTLLVWLVHDAWSTCAYYQKLMLLYALPLSCVLRFTVSLIDLIRSARKEV